MVISFNENCSEMYEKLFSNERLEKKVVPMKIIWKMRERIICKELESCVNKYYYKYCYVFWL